MFYTIGHSWTYSDIRNCPYLGTKCPTLKVRLERFKLRQVEVDAAIWNVTNL